MESEKPIAILAQTLGARLASYRLSRNLRQQDIADRSGISRGAVVRIEAGQGGTIDSLLRILQALEVEDRIELLLPDARLNPLDTRSETGPRQRARKAPDTRAEDQPWTWGE